MRIHSYPVAGVTNETIRDEFNIQAYNNNDGTQTWASSWVEGNDDGDPTDGKIEVDKDNFLKIEQDSRTIARTADLTNATNATLSFDYRRKDEFKSKYVIIEISADNGTSWTELDRFTGTGKDDQFIATSYDISSYISPNTVIRFSASSDLDKKKLYVDNVEIAYTIDTADPPPADPPPADPPPADPPPADPPPAPVDEGFDVTIRDDFNSQFTFYGNDGMQPWGDPGMGRGQ